MEPRKDDSGKLDLGIILKQPDDILRCIIKALEAKDFGAKKYSEDNWRQLPDLTERYCRSAARHVRERLRGKPGEVDHESGLPVLAHAICSALFVMADDLAKGAERQGTGRLGVWHSLVGRWLMQSPDERHSGIWFWEERHAEFYRHSSFEPREIGEDGFPV